MFWEKYKKLCFEKKLSPNAVAKDLSISSGTITRWKNGSEPQAATLAKVADYFGVTTDYLLSDDEKKPVHVDEPLGMTEKEKTVIRAYRSKPDMQPAVDKLLGIEEVKHEYYTAAYKDDSTIETNEEQFNYLLSIPSTTDDLMGGQNKK